MNHEISVLAKKLLIKPGKRWLFYNAPDNYLVALEPLPDGAEAKFATGGSFDGIQLFVKNSSELLASIKIIATLLKPDTIFWISYPKRSSGIESDLKMGSWDMLAEYNLDGVASIAVNDTWAGSRFRPLGQAKISGVGNAEIKGNEYAAHIDVDNKIITLPRDMEAVFESNPAAMSFYQSLSYSNRKEYVLWILTAKQEKTLTERLTKMVEKLRAGKKNPSEK
jgi:hypothetical protein